MLRTMSALLALVAFPALPSHSRRPRPARSIRSSPGPSPTTGVPSAEIAIVRDGQIVLNKAYGKANEGHARAARPALPDRFQLQAVHGDGDPAPARTRASSASTTMSPSSCPESPKATDHHPRAAQPHLRPAGLLAAGLHVRRHDACRRRRSTSSTNGRRSRSTSSRATSGNIQQHRLCRRRHDRREGQRRAAADLPQGAHLPAARNDQRPRPGRDQHAGLSQRATTAMRSGRCAPRSRPHAAGSMQRASCR